MSFPAYGEKEKISTVAKKVFFLLARNRSIIIVGEVVN